MPKTNTSAGLLQTVDEPGPWCSHMKTVSLHADDLIIRSLLLLQCVAKITKCSAFYQNYD